VGHSLLKLFGSGAVHPTKDAGGQLKDGPGAGAGGVGAGGVGGGGFGLGATGLGVGGFGAGGGTGTGFGSVAPYVGIGVTGPGGTGLGGNDDCNERVQNATSSAFITNFPSTCLLLL